MSESEPPPSGRQQFLEALHVKRNASIGMAFGIVVTIAVYWTFVYVPGTYRPSALYVVLAFTLALATGGLATIILLVIRAWRLTRRI